MKSEISKLKIQESEDGFGTDRIRAHAIKSSKQEENHSRVLVEKA